MFEWLSSLPIWAQVAVGVVLGGILLTLLFAVLTTEVGCLGCGLFAGGVLILSVVGFVLLIAFNNPSIRWGDLIAGVIGFLVCCSIFSAVIGAVDSWKNRNTKIYHLNEFVVPDPRLPKPFICSFRNRSGRFRAAMGESAEIISTTPQKALLEYVRGLEGKPYPKEAHYLFAESEEGRVVHKFSIPAFEEYAEVKRTDTDSV